MQKLSFLTILFDVLVWLTFVFYLVGVIRDRWAARCERERRKREEKFLNSAFTKTPGVPSNFSVNKSARW